MSITDTYVYPWYISISSFALNHDERINLVVQHDKSLSVKNRDFMKELMRPFQIDLNFLEMDSDILADLPFAKLWHPIVWYKIFAPDHDVFEGKPFLHLDSDMLTIASIKLDFDNFLNSGKALGAVVEPRLHREFETRFQPREKSGWYFNAGLLFINQQKWLENGIGLRIREVLSKYTELRLDSLDQDVLNLVFMGDQFRLNKFLNSHNELLFSKNLKNGKILHFIWKLKPWLFSKEDKRILCLLGVSKYGPAFHKYFNMETACLAMQDKVLSDELESIRLELQLSPKYLWENLTREFFGIKRRLGFFNIDFRKY
jgi:lipopolysaccharide biosynthesis glycosyltransferase